jgi:predicted amidophosphoribosyltransferase
LVRPTFGKWLAKKLPDFSADPILVVPVPSKDALPKAASYRSIEMAREALKGSARTDSVYDALRWDEVLKPAHESGPRGRAELLPHLQARGELAGQKIVLVDDLITTGGSLLACKDKLEAAGATVLGAITCGRTVYDAKVPPFKECEFDLTGESSDFRATGPAT